MRTLNTRLTTKRPRQTSLCCYSFAAIASHALELGAEEACAARLGHHPWSHLPRWLVTHVLRMTANEIRHPMSLVILVVPDDFALHNCGSPANASVQLFVRSESSEPRSG